MWNYSAKMGKINCLKNWLWLMWMAFYRNGDRSGRGVCDGIVWGFEIILEGDFGSGFEVGRVSGTHRLVLAEQEGAGNVNHPRVYRQRP